jgi:hypothetical protein
VRADCAWMRGRLVPSYDCVERSEAATVAGLPNFASGGVTIMVPEVQDTERTASPLGQQVASSRA